MATQTLDDIKNTDIDLQKTPNNEEDRMTHATAASENADKFHKRTLVSNSKRKLNEKDLLKMCVDDPKYLSKALGHN